MNSPCSEKKERTYAVIDLKSFYASCECADRGLDIFSTPLVVADKERTLNTIVMSVTPYLKEKFGVPNVCRLRDVPEVRGMIYATPRMAYYIDMSAKVVSILLDFVAEEDLHVYSIDESFIRIDPYLRAAKATAEEFCGRILKRIKDELGLVATAGIGPNMFLAKICLDNEAKKKPPYIAYWHYEDVPTKLWSITPITKIWGIADGIATRLYRLGIRNLEALAKAEIKTLEKEFGIMGNQLKNLANGIDEANIEEKYEPRERNLSIGQTLMKDYDIKGAKLVLREMNDDLCARLRKMGQKCGCVSVYVGYSAKEGGGFSRQSSLNISADDNFSLFEAVESLYEKHVENLPIRGLGIGFTKLTSAQTQQYSLFESPSETNERARLCRAIDRIHSIFGENSVLRASSLLADSTARARHGQIGGHRA